MRKIQRIAAGISIAIAAAVGISLTYAGPASAAEGDRYITVTGTGTVNVTPDAVRVYASVSALADTSKAALASGSTTAAAVRASLKASGIATKDIKSSNLTVFPEYNYTQDKGSVVIGYRATQSFNIVVRKADTAGTVIDSLVEAGGNNLMLNSVVPFLTKGSAATEDARAAAVADAKARATSYAKLLGVSLGRVIYLTENSAPNYSFPIMASTKADNASTQIDLGEEEVTVTVTVKWALN